MPMSFTLIVMSNFRQQGQLHKPTNFICITVPFVHSSLKLLVLASVVSFYSSRQIAFKMTSKQTQQGKQRIRISQSAVTHDNNQINKQRSLMTQKTNMKQIPHLSSLLIFLIFCDVIQ
ncbi:mCG147071 [Mus musculus]|nr:mCG147071 [Mus musculus]